MKTGYSGAAQIRYPPYSHSFSIGPERWCALMYSTAFTGLCSSICIARFWRLGKAQKTTSRDAAINTALGNGRSCSAS